MATVRAPRASLTQKISVLDYYRGPPQRSQAETLKKFVKDGDFAISQATLSSWILNESRIRSTYENNPNLVNYRKNPVLKYPEVTKAVESHIEQNAAKGVVITDQLIKDCFSYYLGIYGYDKDKVKLSTGMIHSFKKRNFIKKGKKYSQPGIATPLPVTDDKDMVPSPSATETPVVATGRVPHPISDLLLQTEIDSIPTQINTSNHVAGILDNAALGFNTRLIHSDDSYSTFFNILGGEPATSTTVNPQSTISDGLQTRKVDAIIGETGSDVDGPTKRQLVDNFSYSRTTHPNSEKVEKILENITNGHVTLYNSGTSAIMGLLTYLNSRKIAVNRNGYQGTHQVIKLLSKLTGVQKVSLNEYDQLEQNDIMIIESPMNPEGYCVDIAKYSRLAHFKGALLAVDSTLAPPPLQDPFVQGADYIIHSATKYFSGHSDLLAGFIVSKTKQQKLKLIEERFSLGTNIANFDSFLLLRSLRTFKMRILQQCSNTFQLIKFLVANLASYPIIIKIHHSSLQLDAFAVQQLNGYYNPVFAIEVKSMDIAKTLLTRFKFLNPKNNLTGGGVETTVELANMNPNFVNLDQLDADSLQNLGINRNLLRLSIGCEDHEDLIRDFDQALSSFNVLT